MKFSTTLTTCMFTLIAVAGCDPEIDGTDLDLREQHEQLDEVASERMTPGATDLADAYADDVDDADIAMSLDPDLALADAPDGARAACQSGSVEYSLMPSGLCGGCLINDMYAGQKWINRKRECKSGAWTAWLPNGSQCWDC